ncbi:hypothetical protein BJ322DRAFT_843293 [Thelephora terrestris]|uniref:DUF6593 domain-containing protein n=1 Tax=Thelephora terrestris TaxID=56493 RepID=A0A9P6L6F9_9AGAM|nr:hypothetical protein BJ322DRAFT_843293 [Thelephora terrestris]
MSSKLLFTHCSPLETAVVIESTGHPLYEIETESNTVQKTTIVRKLDLNRGEENIPHTNEEIARIHWNLIVPDEVTFQGRTMAKERFIHKTGSGSEEHYIIHAQGAEYRWIRRDRSDGSPKLVKSDQEQTFVAQFHRTCQLLPPDVKDSVLEVSPEGAFILDHILVSFIFVEKEFRSRDKSPGRSPEPSTRSS